MRPSRITGILLVVNWVLLTSSVWGAEGKDVAYRSGDETVHGLLFAPPGKGPFPGLLAIHAVFGLDEWTKEQASKLADAGYLVLTLDFYQGKVAKSLDEGVQLSRAVPMSRKQQDVLAAVHFLRSQRNVARDRVGSIGWCMGGRWAFQLATLDPLLKAAVVRYGALSSDPSVLAKTNARILGIFGGKDTSIPIAEIHSFEQQMKSLGKQAEIVIYPDAGHAFEYPESTAKGLGLLKALYPADAAYQGPRPDDTADAWKRTVDFLDANLKSDKSVSDAEQEVRHIAPSSSALDAVKVDPKHYKIDFENDRVRVVRIHYGPHEKSPMHTHPSNRLSVYLTDFHMKQTLPDGTTQENHAKPGVTLWRSTAVKHASENLSDQPMEALWVELKPPAGVSKGSENLSRDQYHRAEDERAKDEEAIKKHVADYVDAYNAHNSERMDALFADDHDSVVRPGRMLKGKAALHDLFIQRHSAIAKTSHLTRTIENIRFMKPDVAVVDGRYEAIGMTDEKGRPAASLTAWVTEILTKDNNRWRGVVFRAIPLDSLQTAHSAQPGSANSINTPADDESAIRKIWTDYEQAWNRHEAKALASFYTEDGDAVFPSGRKASGRAAVEAAEAANHSSINRSSHTTREIQAIRFITPDVALIDGSAEITGMVGANGESLPVRQGLMTMMLVKRSGLWRIAANRAMVPVTGASASLTGDKKAANLKADPVALQEILWLEEVRRQAILHNGAAAPLFRHPLGKD